MTKMDLVAMDQLKKRLRMLVAETGNLADPRVVAASQELDAFILKAQASFARAKQSADRERPIELL